MKTNRVCKVMLIAGAAVTLSTLAPSKSMFHAMAADHDAPGTAGAPATADARGTVVSVAPLAHLSTAQTAAYLKNMRFGSPAPRNGVDAYRAIYRTVTPAGGPTTASGLVVLPRDRNKRLRLVNYQHGTNPTKKAAATVDPQSEDRAATVLFAGAGYAAVAPDYLGLGYGPGHHPYEDVASETTASVDMLRAARTVASGKGRQLDPRVMVTGFSQGGPAAMALGRALQQGAAYGFGLGALAPVSGPYDLLNAEIPAALGTRPTLDPKEVTFYFGYWLTSMNRLHHLYDRPSQMFRAPYDKTVETLYDGLHSGDAIYAGIPATPQQLLTTRALRSLQHPTGAILKAIAENDTTCTNWTPRAPVRLYAAHGDRDVTIVNAKHCQAALRGHHVNVPLIDVGNVDHSGSGLRSMPQIVAWFERLATP